VRELVNQSTWFTDACAPNRKQDTTEEYPKGRNSCLVLNLLICVSSITFAKQIRYKLDTKLDTKPLQAIKHLEFRIYFNHPGAIQSYQSSASAGANDAESYRMREQQIQGGSRPQFSSWSDDRTKTAKFTQVSNRQQCLDWQECDGGVKEL
jgi:hypothetical protein